MGGRWWNPGVKEHVTMMAFSPSHSGWSAMTLAWVVTSWGESWGSSLGCVWIQPSGSRSWKGGRQRVSGRGKGGGGADLDELVLGQGLGQVDDLVSAPLGREDDAADLLDLGVVRGRDAVQVPRDL